MDMFDRWHVYWIDGAIIIRKGGMNLYRRLRHRIFGRIYEFCCYDRRKVAALELFLLIAVVAGIAALLWAINLLS